MNEKLKEWTDLLFPVMQVGVTRLSVAHVTTLGDRDARGQREPSRYPRRGPFRFQREQFDKWGSLYYPSYADYQSPLDTSQCHKYSSRPAADSLRWYQSQAGRPS